MSDNPFEEGNAEPNPFQVRARSLDLDARARPPFKRARPSSVRRRRARRSSPASTIAIATAARVAVVLPRVAIGAPPRRRRAVGAAVGRAPRQISRVDLSRGAHPSPSPLSPPTTPGVRGGGAREPVQPVPDGRRPDVRQPRVRRRGARARDHVRRLRRRRVRIRRRARAVGVVAAVGGGGGGRVPAQRRRVRRRGHRAGVRGGRVRKRLEIARIRRRRDVGPRAGVGTTRGGAASKARSISHWSPYDRVRVVHADP